ncbi:hypothetical protein [Streptomyces sp. NPDC046862]|uniref:hypothetical protein n=1 Tax=Streptomyces sp. NPDC046862 TaxID=3154603 RepID=UPI003454A03A
MRLGVGLRWLLATAMCAGLLAAAVVAIGGSDSAAQPPKGNADAASGPGQDPPRKPTTAEVDVLHRAEQLLIRGCMAEKGFRYWPAPRLPAPDYREFPYGIDDETWAARHGYGRDIEQRLERNWKDSEGKRYLDSLPKARYEAYGDALYGPSEGGDRLKAKPPMGGTLSHSKKGCVADSWRSLYGDVRAWYRSIQVVNGLPGMRVGRVAEDPAFRSALAKWRDCMKRRGHVAENPPALRDIRLRDTGRGAQAKDVRTAVDEAECGRTTGLSATAKRLDRQYSDVLYGEYRTAYDTARRMQLDALPKARGVVGRG